MTQLCSRARVAWLAVGWHCRWRDVPYPSGRRCRQLAPLAVGFQTESPLCFALQAPPLRQWLTSSALWSERAFWVGEGTAMRTCGVLAVPCCFAAVELDVPPAPEPSCLRPNTCTCCLPPAGLPNSIAWLGWQALLPALQTCCPAPTPLPLPAPLPAWCRPFSAAAPMLQLLLCRIAGPLPLVIFFSIAMWSSHMLSEVCCSPVVPARPGWCMRHL